MNRFDGTYRYAPYEPREWFYDWLRLGWFPAFSTGQWSHAMQWVCCCGRQPVEPRR